VRSVVDQIAEALAGGAENIICFDTVDSTHRVAQRLVEQLDVEGIELKPTLILAATQSAGQGRGDRHWVSGEGGLYLSWLVSGLEPSVIGRLPLLAAAAVWSALDEAGLDGHRIKWPNDILVGGRKLAGILVHARHSDPTWSIVGLGVNLSSAPDVGGGGMPPATALVEHLPARSWDEWAPTLVAGFVRSLNASLIDHEPAIALWRNHLAHHEGDLLAVRLASGEVRRGVFAGLTDDGFLRLGLKDEVQVIAAGDVIEGD